MLPVATLLALMGLYFSRIPSARGAGGSATFVPVDPGAGAAGKGLPAGGRDAPPSPATSVPEPPARTAVAQAGTTLRIMTWNVRDCAANGKENGTRLAFHDAIAAVVKDMRADVAAFEEIQQDDEKGGDIALLQVALAKAGWAMPYQASVETGGPDDIAVFSKYRIVSSEAVLEPSGQDTWPRPGIHAEIEAGKTRLDLYAFHFKAMPDAASEGRRRAQAKAVADLLRRTRNGDLISRYVVVAGDLNTTNPGDRDGRTSTIGYLELRDDADTANDFTAVNERMRPVVPTYVDDRFSSVLDHLVLSPAAVAAMASGSPVVRRDIPVEQGVPVSDHRPVLAELALP